MEVFISWSGERSRLLAKALAELLPDVIQDTKAWMSDHDIGAGSRWISELDERLENCNFGILCLTPENLNASWLLFEAGSLAKSVSLARVIPYRMSLTATDVPFPLAQFQGVDANKEGTWKIIESLNNSLSFSLDRERLDRSFQRVWPDLEARILAIPSSGIEHQPRRSDRDLLEELLNLVREKSRI